MHPKAAKLNTQDPIAIGMHLLCEMSFTQVVLLDASIHKGTQTLSIVALSIVNFLAYYNMSLKNRSNEHRFFVNHPDG